MRFSSLKRVAWCPHRLNFTGYSRPTKIAPSHLPYTVDIYVYTTKCFWIVPIIVNTRELCQKTATIIRFDELNRMLYKRPLFQAARVCIHRYNSFDWILLLFFYIQSIWRHTRSARSTIQTEITKVDKIFFKMFEILRSFSLNVFIQNYRQIFRATTRAR